MFILRTITSDGLETNRTIGDFYELIRKNGQITAFDKLYREIYLQDQSNDNTVRAFIVIPSGEAIHLYAENYYYIMTESGQTFCKITF